MSTSFATVAASLPEVRLFSDLPSVQADSGSPSLKNLCLNWSSDRFLLQGKPFPPPPTPAGHFDGRFSRRVGCLFAPSPSVGEMVCSRGTCPYILSRVEGGVSCPPGLRRPSLEPIGSDSFGQRHSCLVPQSSRRDSFCGTLSVTLCHSALELLSWCRERGILLSALLVPGRTFS